MERVPRLPWGFVMGPDKKLTCTTSQAELRRRAEQGETAIRLLGALGIKPDFLDELVDVEDTDQLLERLQRQRT